MSRCAIAAALLVSVCAAEAAACTVGRRAHLSDQRIGRPANGKFTAWRRDMYNIYLRLYQALMSYIRPSATPEKSAISSG